MIRKVKEIKPHRHHEDVERIQRVILQNGYEADYDDAAKIWDDFSDSYSAGWLGLPDDDKELWQIIKDIVEKEAV